MKERKSCMNIQPTNAGCFVHVSHKIMPSYAIASPDRNSYDLEPEEAEAYYLKLMDDAINNYMSRTKQNIQVDPDKLLWEAIFVLEHFHTLDDVKKLAKHFEEKYEWQPIQMAIHRNEGYRNEMTGEIVYNYHAHIIFLMLSKEGIYVFKKRDFRKKKMALLQTEVANILRLKRGKSKLITGNIHYSQSQFREIEKERSDLKSEILRLSNEVDTFENVWLEDRETNIAFEKEVSVLKKKINKRDKKIKELEESIEESVAFTNTLSLMLQNNEDALDDKDDIIGQLKEQVKQLKDENSELLNLIDNGSIGPGMVM